MNWEAIGAVGEVGGAIGVIASLLYLAGQIRHNTKAVASNTDHASLQFAQGISLLMVGNPEVAALVARGAKDPDDLSEDEWARFVEIAYMRFGLWEQALTDWEKGLTDDDSWRGWDMTSRHVTSGPGYRKFWEEARPGFMPSFQKHIDGGVLREA